MLQNYVGENIIIGGDLNINLDTVQQSIVSSENLGYAKILHQIVESLNVDDIWRIKNPESVHFTQREQTRFGLKQSRIDFFLVSQNMQYLIKKADILPSIRSDHSFCSFLSQWKRSKKGNRLVEIKHKSTK